MRMRFLRISPLLLGALTFATAGLMPRPAAGQTPFVPYFGKNQVRYDRFDWHIYKTDHFEIFYYPALEQHLERVAAYAESAYQHVSAELKHDLAEKVPLILFKTRERVPGEQHRPGRAARRRPGVRRARARTGWCCRSTSRPTSSTSSSRTS